MISTYPLLHPMYTPHTPPYTGHELGEEHIQVLREQVHDGQLMSVPVLTGEQLQQGDAGAATPVMQRCVFVCLVACGERVFVCLCV